jgi:hypothetical protein
MTNHGIPLLCAAALFTLFAAEPSEQGTKGGPRISKTQLADEQTAFRSKTADDIGNIKAQLATKIEEKNLKSIREDLDHVKEKATETAFEMNVVILVGTGGAFLLGVVVTRLVSVLIPDRLRGH